MARSRGFSKASLFAALCGLLFATLAAARDLPSTLRSPVDDPRQNGRCKGRYSIDFTDPKYQQQVVNITKWNGDPKCADFVSEFYKGDYKMTPEGLRLNLNRADKLNQYGKIGGQETAVSWSHWWQYGKTCVTMKVARGGGLISAFMVDSYTPGAAVDDELDIELTGIHTSRFETVWFGLNKLNNSNGGIHEFSPDGFDNFHEYCFQRTPDAIYYTLDGDTKRGVFKKDIGDVFPYRTAKIVITIWDAGTSNDGAASWSGGPTNWTDYSYPDYRMIIKSWTVECADEQGKVEDVVIAHADPTAKSCDFFEAPVESSSSVSGTKTASSTVAAASSTRLATTSSLAAASSSSIAALSTSSLTVVTPSSATTTASATASATPSPTATSTSVPALGLSTSSRPSAGSIVGPSLASALVATIFVIAASLL